MPPWLQALQTLGAAPAVLITVAQTQGSTPREAGARMLVTSKAQFDTIGGGHLEWEALARARSLLADIGAAVAHLQHFALGPSLGQCCGGTVELLFEPVDAQSQAMILALAQAWEQGREVWRVVPLGAATRPYLLDPSAASAHAAGTHLGRDASGQPCLYDRVLSRRPQVVLFGAGHVGHAVARLLATLQCRLQWVDQRDDAFPADVPQEVEIEATDIPTAVVREAPPGSYFLVMTHSHALDLSLVEAVLQRDDFAWCGLIGSDTKRAQFERRLVQRGFSADQVKRVTCPIGIEGIDSKQPAAIAVAVAAQLLQLWQARLGS